MTTNKPESSHGPQPSPRVVLVVSNGPLLTHRCALLATRPTVHASIRIPPLPLPALAMTAATGVSPLSHGIVTGTTIDPDDLSLRDPIAADRRFSAFWTDAAGAGIRTLTIDWPATEGDPDLPDSISPQRLTQLIAAKTDLEGAPTGISPRCELVLQEAHAALSADTPPEALALVLRQPKVNHESLVASATLAEQIEALIAAIPSDTVVLLVHLDTEAHREGEGSSLFPYALTVIGGPAPTNAHNEPIMLGSVGGTMRRLLGTSCPKGVIATNWPFLPLPPLSGPDARGWPWTAKVDTTDWDDVVRRVVECRAGHSDGDDPATSALLKRFSSLSAVALSRYHWAELKQLAGWLISLQGRALHHWWHIYALDRLGEQDLLREAIAVLSKQYPNQTITSLAECLTLVRTTPEKAEAQLLAIEQAGLSIDSALGTFGRLCLNANLLEAGERAIGKAIARGVETRMDRATLASYLLAQGRPIDAGIALGRVGRPNGPVTWAITRLRILLATEQRQAAESLAAEILECHPGDPTVPKLMTA